MNSELYLTLDQVRTTMAAVVAERPYYVYRCPDEDWYQDRCRYWHPSEDGPGCLIGMVLHRLFPTVITGAFLCAQEGNSPVAILRAAGIGFDQWVPWYLNAAQEAQDSSYTWQEAYDRAELELEGVNSR